MAGGARRELAATVEQRRQPADMLPALAERRQFF
jgi:hypothetical protein